jgi:hypothetical protein
MSKISELSDGGVIQGGDTLIAVRSGGNVKVTYGGSTTANIDGGTIDGTVIGGTTAAAGTFTTGQFNTSLNVAGSDAALAASIGTDAQRVYITPNGTVINYNASGDSAGSHLFQTGNVNRLNIASNGDISFYEDTGTTARFSWSSANETISIGSGASSTATISAYSRTVSANLPSALRIIENTGASSYWDIGSTGGASNNLNFYANANTTPKVTFTGAGNVGIAGQTNPTYKLDGGFADQTWGWYLNSSYNAGFTYNTAERSLLLATRSAENIDHIKFATGSAATERVRIDSSGNVGIGVVPSAWGTGAGVRGLEVGANLAASQDINSVYFSANAYNSATGWKYRNTQYASNLRMGTNDGVFQFQQAASGTAGAAITWATPMTLDASGNLLVGTTSAVTGSVAGGFQVQNNSGTGSTINIGHPSSAANGFSYALFSHDNSIIGSIGQSGTTAVLYNTTSDQRLKENITDANDAGDKIDAIKVRQYDWKADGSHQDYGMVAQELMTVAPEAVSVPEDPEKMMGVDYSKLVPMMLKEIQSLRARVAQLEGAN